jgi:hypothetical protein
MLLAMSEMAGELEHANRSQFAGLRASAVHA